MRNIAASEAGKMVVNAHVVIFEKAQREENGIIQLAIGISNYPCVIICYTKKGWEVIARTL